MINLIKNELIKIFHKKSIYVLMLVSILFLSLQTILLKSIDTETDEEYYQTIEKDLSSNDFKNYENRQIYISQKTELDAWHNARKYDRSSWQFYMIINNTDDLFCQNESKYEKEDEERASECEKNYQAFLDKVANHDWTYFIKEEKATKEEELTSLKDSLLNTDDEKEKYDLEKSINILEYEIEGLNYRLEKSIPPANNKSSRLVEIYVLNAISLLDYPKDDSEYQNSHTLEEKRQYENMMNVAKYKLDNDIEVTEYPDANIIISQEFEYVILFVVIAAIMIAGSIVAEEYSKGTIKQLLLRPYSRTKILLSKYIAAIITFLAFLIFYYIADIIANGIAVGFDTIEVPLIVYNFTTKSIHEVSLLSYCLSHVLTLLPEYLIILTISFAASTIVGSSAVSLAIGFMSSIVGDIVNSLALNYNIKFLRFFPTMCWDFSPYLYGGTPAYKYSNISISVIVCLITLTILIGASIIFFKHKNIKNQ